MPVEVSYDADNNVTWRTIRGDVSIEELISSITESLNHPDFRPGVKSLMDFRQVTSFGKPTDVQQYTSLLFQYKDKLAGIRVAVVVSDDLAYGLTRMLQVYVDRLPIKISVFRDIDEAKEWLGID